MSREKTREGNTTKEKIRNWRRGREERNSGEDKESRQKEGILIEGTDKGWKPSFTEWWGCTHITRYLPRIHSVRWVPSIPFISTTPSSGLSEKSPGRHSAADSHTWNRNTRTLIDNWIRTHTSVNLFSYGLHAHTNSRALPQIPAQLNENLVTELTASHTHTHTPTTCKKGTTSGWLCHRIRGDHRSHLLPWCLISRLAWLPK